MSRISLQFHTDLEEHRLVLEKVVRDRFNKLKERYDESLNVTVNLDKGEKDETPYQMKATVLAKTKMRDFVATKIEKIPLTAIHKSFDAVERQLRKFLDKISKPWEKHHEDV